MTLAPVAITHAETILLPEEGSPVLQAHQHGHDRVSVLQRVQAAATHRRGKRADQDENRDPGAHAMCGGHRRRIMKSRPPRYNERSGGSAIGEVPKWS